MFNPFTSPGPKIRLLNPIWWVLFIALGVYRYATKIIPNTCRFIPTCSTYARDALANYGVLKSIRLIVVRLLKCHPFNPGGFDYVPIKNNPEQDLKDSSREKNTDSSK